MSQCMWTDPIHERNNTVTSQVAPGCMNLMSVGYNFPLPKRVPFPLPPLPCLEKRHMSRLQRAAGASYVSLTESGGSVICLAYRERRERHMSRLQRAVGASYVSPAESGGSANVRVSGQIAER